MTQKIVLTLPNGALTPEQRAAIGDLVLRMARGTGGIGLEFSGDDSPEPFVLPIPRRSQSRAAALTRSVDSRSLRTASGNNHRRPPSRRAKQAATKSAKRTRSPESIQAFKDTMARKRADREKADSPQGQPTQSHDGPNATADLRLGQTPLNVVVPPPAVYLAAMNDLKVLAKLRRDSREVAPIGSD